MPTSSVEIQQTAVYLPEECAPRLFLDVFAATDFLFGRYGDTPVSALQAQGVKVCPIRMQVAGCDDAG